MILRQRFLLLIHILCCAAAVYGILLDTNDAETCNLLCVRCNASAVFADGYCECNFADDGAKVSSAECIQNVQREIQAIELNMLSEDLTDEERKVRSIIKYRRRLRPGDAEKVTQYFINGGPAAGHSHFVRAFDGARNSADSATNSFSGVVGESNPENGFHSAPLTRLNSWNTYDSPLYMVSESARSYASPTMHGAENPQTYPPILMQPSYAYTYPNEFYGPTGLLGSVHPDGGPLHTLFRAATFPVQVLQHILHPRIYHHPRYHRRGFVRSSNLPSDSSDDDIIGQPYKNNDDSTSNLPIARNKAEKSAEQNVFGLIDPPYIAQVPFYQPMGYQNFPYQYTPYSPLINTFHPVTNGYVLQPVSPYARDASDPLTSASNPRSFCANNVNTEQSGVLTADKTGRSDEAEKSDDATRNNIPIERKTEKNRTDKL